jgi:hypothetical protein
MELQKAELTMATVSADDVTSAYSAADASTKKVLEGLFPDILVTENTYDYVTSHIKTYDDALSATGMSSTISDETMASLPADAQAYLKLRVVCAALNGLKSDTLGTFPAYTDDEQIYYPSFIAYTTSAYNALTDAQKENVHLFNSNAGTNEYCALACNGSVSATEEQTTEGVLSRKFNVGSRLTLKAYDRAQYCGKQFIDLWAAFIFGKTN